MPTDSIHHERIVFQGEAIAYRIRFNARRKTRSVIRILPDGGVLVDVPPWASLPQVRQWVATQADWLLRRRREMARGPGFVAPLRYVEGEAHLFLGERYRLALRHTAARAAASGIAGGSLCIATPRVDPDAVKARLWRWYRDQAQAIFHQRLTALGAGVPWLASLPPLKLRRMRRRWGSCSVQGVITLNTHLVKAQPASIDYVILHELCHLREHNHSPRFYRLMDQVLPAWRERKRALDEQAAVIGNE